MVTTGENIRILLMEDELDLGKTLQDMLEDEGYFVRWVRDGIVAEEVIYDEKFDLYIFDINVPKLNGLELLESLRNKENKTPVIFISALVDLETMKKAFKIGAEDYIKKPFYPEELLFRIEAKFHTLNDNIKYKELQYNPTSKELKKGKEVIFLSKKQQELFHIFITQFNITIEPSNLMEYTSITSLPALRVAINKLKLMTGVDIRSIHGIGYRLEAR